MNDQATESLSVSSSPSDGQDGVNARIAAMLSEDSAADSAPADDAQTPVAIKAKAAKEDAVEPAEAPAEPGLRDRIKAIREDQQRKQEASVLRKKAEHAERLHEENVALRQRLSAAEQIRARITDKSEFFAVAKEAGVTPQELANWLQSAADDPNVVMREQARKAIDPEIARLNAQVEQMAAIMRRQEEHNAAQSEQAAQREFMSIVQARPDSTLARFQAKYGAEKVLAMADAAARSGEIPQGSSLQDLADVLDERLSELSGIGAPAPLQKQSPKASKSPSPATRNINSRLTSERTSVASVEDDLDSMSVEERMKWLASQM